ncbi:MAG TPA: DUF3883 domain-containing protein [Gemmatimonadales bacterium]|nr:DUF3883 domain-containing protein [Gemmatimonadales bacterium]
MHPAEGPARWLDDDHEYSQWLASHPAGFVANVTADGNKNYFVIHRSICHTITPGSSRVNSEGAHTEHAYRKVVADTEAEVVGWGVDYGYQPAAMRACQICRKGEAVQGGLARKLIGLLANAHQYDVERAARELPEDTWTLPAGDVAPGDRGLIWRTRGTDGKRGIVALFDVVAAPEEDVEPTTSIPYWLGAPPGRARRFRLRYVLTSKLPVWLDPEEPGVLGELTVSRAQGTKAYHVTEDQWARVMDLVGGWEAASAAAPPSVGAKPPRGGGGQGRRQSPRVRRAIERYAMRVVEAHLEAAGWTLTDTSKGNPYDLLAVRGNAIRYVEVKGTSGGGDTIEVTAGEVKHARAHPAETTLALVTGISVDETDPERPVCSGGELRVVERWAPAEEDLDPTVFRCKVRYR